MEELGEQLLNKNILSIAMPKFDGGNGGLHGRIIRIMIAVLFDHTGV